MASYETIPAAAAEDGLLVATPTPKPTSLTHTSEPSRLKGICEVGGFKDLRGHFEPLACI